MKRTIASLLVVLLLIPTVGSRCFGGFVLTRKWHGFISGINNKWLRWIVFLITCIVYGIAIWVDAIIFNSIEFWSGSNPMAHGDFDDNGEFVRVQEKDGEKVVYTYREYGEVLSIDMYKDGDFRGNMTLLRSQPGVFFRETNGRLEELDVSRLNAGDRQIIHMRANGKVVESRAVETKEYELSREFEGAPAY